MAISLKWVSRGSWAPYSYFPQKTDFMGSLFSGEKNQNVICKIIYQHAEQEGK